MFMINLKNTSVSSSAKVGALLIGIGTERSLFVHIIFLASIDMGGGHRSIRFRLIRAGVRDERTLDGKVILDQLSGVRDNFSGRGLDSFSSVLGNLAIGESVTVSKCKACRGLAMFFQFVSLLLELHLNG